MGRPAFLHSVWTETVRGRGRQVINTLTNSPVQGLTAPLLHGRLALCSSVSVPGSFLVVVLCFLWMSVHVMFSV